MIPTPQVPSVEQAQSPNSNPPTGQPAQAVEPPSTTFQPAPPLAGWYAAPYVPQQIIPPQQQQLFRPTGGQRVGVAIASIALLTPLVAIAVGTTTSLIPYVTAGVAITAGLVAVTLVCLAVVAVNVAFNFDLLRPKPKQ